MKTLAIGILFAGLICAQLPESKNGKIAVTTNPLVGDGAGNAIAGTPIPPTPATSGNFLISGGSVAWAGGLVFVVQAATYQINGVQYTSPQATLTLVADGAADRIDTIILDSTGAATFLPGTPGGNPSAPVPDPSTQLFLTVVLIPAGSGTPGNITSTLVYDEDTGGPGEWAATNSGAGFNLASLNNPYHLTKDVEATAVTTGNYVLFTAGAPVTMANFNGLVFYIRSKASWPNNRALTFQFQLSGALVGTPVTFNNGAFGFTSSNTASYQQIVLPLSRFSIPGTADSLKVTVGGTGGTIGFYLDFVQLQGGLAGLPNAYLTWRGAWSSSVGYSINDAVVSGGIAYVALAANTNSAPTSSNANWSATARPPVTLRTCAMVIGADNAAAALVDADIAPQGRQCLIATGGTITEITVAADGGTPQVQVAKNHTGTLTNLLSAELPTAALGAVACAATGAACYDGTAKSVGVTIVTAGSANVLAAGDWIETRTATAGGTAKRMSIAVSYTIP